MCYIRIFSIAYCGPGMESCEFYSDANEAVFMRGIFVRSIEIFVSNVEGSGLTTGDIK